MLRFHRNCVVAAVVLATAVNMGCGGGGGPAGGGTYESPEAVFSAAREAMEANKYDEFVACMTPESQDVLVFGLTMAGQMAKAFSGLGGAIGGELGGEEAGANLEQQFAPLDQVLEKYGMTEDAFAGMEGEEPMDPQAAIKLLADKIGDKPAYIGELMGALNAIGDGDSPGPQAMFAAELSDVKIEGDTATATATATGAENGGRSGPVHFRQVDGSWLIDMARQMEGMQGS